MNKIVDLAVIEELCLENHFKFDGNFPHSVSMTDDGLEFCWTDISGDECNCYIVEVSNNGSTFKCTDIDGNSHNLMFYIVFNPLEDD